MPKAFCTAGVTFASLKVCASTHLAMLHADDNGHKFSTASESIHLDPSAAGQALVPHRLWQVCVDGIGPCLPCLWNIHDGKQPSFYHASSRRHAVVLQDSRLDASSWVPCGEWRGKAEWLAVGRAALAPVLADFCSNHLMLRGLFHFRKGSNN